MGFPLSEHSAIPTFRFKHAGKTLKSIRMNVFPLFMAKINKNQAIRKTLFTVKSQNVVFLNHVDNRIDPNCLYVHLEICAMLLNFTSAPLTGHKKVHFMYWDVDLDHI